MNEAAVERWFGPGNDGSLYSSAVRHSDVIYVAGQLGTTSGAPITFFEEQLATALQGLFAAVEALGGSPASILKVNGFLARLEDFAAYHCIYAEAFGANPLPARTTVQIAGFKPPILVELDAVAAVLR